MSQPEFKRHEIMAKIQAKELTHDQAAQLLNINLCQAQRLYARYKTSGSEGLVSRKRGKTPLYKKMPEARSPLPGNISWFTTCLLQPELANFTLGYSRLKHTRTVFIIANKHKAC